MKILTANFVTCAVKACKTSPDAFPLHFRDAELEQVEMEYNPEFIKNILPRIEWEALKITAAELGFTTLPATKPEPGTEAAASHPAGEDTSMADAAPQPQQLSEAEKGGEGAGNEGEDDKLWRDLHTLLIETQVMGGRLVCGSCGHEYRIRDGIANFLLPNHLV